MNRIKEFAARRPLVFLLIVVGIWLLGSRLINRLSWTASGRISPYAIFSAVGMLLLVVAIALLLWRVGWLRPAGISSLGSGAAWLLALAALLYLLSAGWLAVFGRSAYDLSLVSTRLYMLTSSDSPTVRSLILQIFIFFLFEEVFYRGLLLYALVQTWGRSRLGLAAGVVLSALLHAGLTGGVVFSYTAPGQTLAPGLAVFVLGIWLGSLAAGWGSLWPGYLLRGLATAALTIPLHYDLLSSQPLTFYLVLAALELPLAAAGLYLLLRKASTHTAPFAA